MITRPKTPPATLPPAMPLRPGANVRMGRNPLGFWVQGAGGGGDFRHPFPVAVGGGVARVGFGLILANISVEPRIGSVPVSGDDTHPQPTLTLDASLVDASNQSWVCVEVTPENTGRLDEKKPGVVVVQRAHPIVDTGETGRAPLAMLRWKNKAWVVHEIAMFHLRYETMKTAEGVRRHYFL